jgi:hypothetical protein
VHKRTKKIIDASAIRDFQEHRLTIPITTDDTREVTEVQNGVDGEKRNMPFFYNSYGSIEVTDVLRAQGRRVKIIGLTSDKGKLMNGKLGTILSGFAREVVDVDLRVRAPPPAGEPRTAVIIDGTLTAIKLKHENFEILEIPHVPPPQTSVQFRLQQLSKTFDYAPGVSDGRCFGVVKSACAKLRAPSLWEVHYGTFVMCVCPGVFLAYDATDDIVVGSLPMRTRFAAGASAAPAAAEVKLPSDLRLEISRHRIRW